MTPEPTSFHHYLDASHEEIAHLYRELHLSPYKTIQEKIAQVSEHFLGRPYLSGALGEGVTGRFDQNPLYRWDAFDCVTYVNTVIAFALAANPAQFKRMIARINYRQGKVAYENRHHFMSVDWNPCNAALGIVKDITEMIIDAHGHPIHQIASTLIDRPAWFRARTLKDIKLRQDESSADALLAELHALADVMKPEQSQLPYLPIEALVSASGKSNTFLFDQIPHGCVVELVRPNWDLCKEIGTHLNVSHVGFAIRDQRGLMYRQASQLKKYVVDEPLHTYLHERIASPTIKGINLQQVL